jgi:hypothetical protein
MKKLVLGLAIIGSIFTGCSDDDENTTVAPPAEGTISGTITTDTQYAYGNYTLDGIVKVAAGVNFRQRIDYHLRQNNR